MNDALRPRTLLLMGGNALLLMAAVVLWRQGEARIHGIDALPITPVDVPTLTLRSPETHAPLYAAIQDLAVFHSTRFYLAPLPPTVAPVEPPLPGYTFAGAMVLPGSKSFAALRDPGTGQTLRVGVGEQVSGWTVQTIESHRVILAFAEVRREIGTGIGGGSGGLKAVPLSSGTAATANATPKVLGNGALTASRGVGDRSGTDIPRLYRPPPR